MNNETKTQGTNLKMNSNASFYTIGYNKDKIPVRLYFNDEYLNDRLEFAINSKTWKVYIYRSPVGKVTEDGRIWLNEESSN